MDHYRFLDDRLRRNASLEDLLILSLCLMVSTHLTTHREIRVGVTKGPEGLKKLATKFGVYSTFSGNSWRT